MPFRKVPDRVGAFRKWADGEVKNSKLSDSATPSGARGWRRRRTRRRKKAKKEEKNG